MWSLFRCGLISLVCLNAVFHCTCCNMSALYNWLLQLGHMSHKARHRLVSILNISVMVEALIHVRDPGHMSPTEFSLAKMFKYKIHNREGDSKNVFQSVRKPTRYRKYQSFKCSIQHVLVTMSNCCEPTFM